jgi:hypothetical protein
LVVGSLKVSQGLFSPDADALGEGVEGAGQAGALDRGQERVEEPLCLGRSLAR